MKLKRAGIVTKIVILALVIYAGISILSITARISQAEDTRAELSGQVAELTLSNAELKYELEHSEDPETIEDIARNKLGLVKPGEKIFYDVSN